jgi:hypothetical protein
MNKFDIELKEYAEKVRLRAVERRELRERILAYMEYHPLPKERTRLSKSVGIVSEPFTVWSFHSWVFRASATAFVLFIVVVIPFLAERSLPGDVLYLVKTEINEEIRSKFAASPYEKVAYETSLIERRIAEARLLASEGKLTEEVGAQIAETVKGHANAAQNGIEELRAQNADDAAIAEIAFGSALDVQSAVLGTDEEEEDGASTANIRDAVNTVREEAVAKRGTTTPSYEGLIARVERETTRAYELFKTIQGSATKAEVDDIERRLSDIGRSIEAAREMHDDGEEGAKAELVASLGGIQKLIVFMTDIDVRNSVELETLIPVVLTREERVTVLTAQIEGIVSGAAAVRERADSLEVEAVVEKVAIGLADIEMILADATSTLLANPETDLKTVEGRVREAEALMRDLMALTGLRGEDVESAEPVTEDTETDPSLEAEGEEGGEVGTTTPALPDESATTSEPVATTTLKERERPSREDLI